MTMGDAKATLRFLILDGIAASFSQGCERTVDAILERLRHALPELPPGYEVTFSDDNADPKYNGWDIWIRGDIYDGRLPDEELPTDRADVVDECWSIWLRECGVEWRAFIEAMRDG
jgi:hypothetical protein